MNFAITSHNRSIKSLLLLRYRRRIALQGSLLYALLARQCVALVWSRACAFCAALPFLDAAYQICISHNKTANNISNVHQQSKWLVESLVKKPSITNPNHFNRLLYISPPITFPSPLLLIIQITILFLLAFFFSLLNLYHETVSPIMPKS